MKLKELASIFSALFLRPQKSLCRHCGGVRCIGLCGVSPQPDPEEAKIPGKPAETPSGTQGNTQGRAKTPHPPY